MPEDDTFRCAFLDVVGYLTNISAWQQRQETDVLPEDMAALASALLESIEPCEEPMSVPIGGMIAFVNSNVPDGFLICDGSSIAINDYPALFDVIGFAYGNPGGGLFKLPLIPNAGVPVMAGGTVGLYQNGGEISHTLTVGEMPAHAHRETVANAVAAFRSQGGAQTQNGIASTSFTNSAGLALNTQNTGDGQAHNNMPPYLGAVWIIRAQ